jgi:DUF4097 and DUF4098 domain-containing protein YvlB
MKRPIVIVLLTVALTLVCLGIGAVVFFAFNNGFPTNNPFISQDVSSVLEESKTLKVDTESPVILNVINDLGKVTIIGADVTTVQIDVIKTAYDSTLEKADQEVKAIKYSIEQNDNTIGVKYEVPNLNDFSEYNTVDFFITVPNQTSTNIEANFGEVNVSNTKGTVDIASDFGDVSVQNIEGALTLENSSGEIEISNVDAGSQDVQITADFGKITLDKVNGKDVNVNSNSGSITLNNVRATGDIFSKSDFGIVTFENGSAASVTIESSSGKVSITKVNIRGTLVITNDFGDIELNQVMAGSYDLDSNSGGITIDGAKGSLKAQTDFGSIDIKNAENVTVDLKSNSGGVDFSGSLGEGPHMIQSDFGGITLTIPADSQLNVDLNTDFGSISSDIPITVTLDGDLEKNHQTGSMNGGGAQLTVKTNNGAIDITAIK